ncbi:MAG: hypothetical protein O7E54_00895 [Planctomycetota bacterium]|nr:hypothetical protein [Planctomycetota bacterium]
MRVLCVFLLVAPVLKAEDAEAEFKTALQVFQAERPTAFAPGASSRVFPAVEALAETKDARATKPLAGLLAATLAQDKLAHKQILKIQKYGATAHERVREIDEELQLLRQRQRAGAREVGPEIVRLDEERAKQMEIFEEAQLLVADQVRLSEYTEELRQELAKVCATLLAAQEGKIATAVIGDIRGYLDVSDRVEALLLVRILRESNRPESSKTLIDIFEHSRAHEAAVRAAIAAAGRLVAEHQDFAGARALVARWARDPEKAGPSIQAALSLAARKHLKTPAGARAWIASAEKTDLFKRGMAEMRAGNRKSGLELLRKALEKNPSAEEVLAVLTQTEYSELLSMLAEGGEEAKVARAVLDKAIKAVKD